MYNKVILIGNLGKDAEVRHFDSGAVKASFTIATSETYKDKATKERKKLTEWHNVVCWGRLAEIAGEYLTKGKLVMIEGKIKHRSWEDGGVTKYITEIEANSFQMMPRGSDSPVGGGNNSSNNTTASSTTASPANNNAANEVEEMDDLPF